MAAVERYLISEEEGLIRLLTPPFENTPQDPGYIKGYVPGVRENGGQYTHAALWVARAFAELGRNDRVAPLLQMLSPIHHARTPGQVDVYEVEPYVVAADVYGAPPHVGRGGWTWYTGSSGWMYRVVLESLLGLRIVGGRTLVLKPCIPDDWPGFAIDYRLPGEETRYDIRCRNPGLNAGAGMTGTIDGKPCPVEDGAVQAPLLHDGHPHRLEVVLGGAGRH
jgi:cyclic beta-1,2-glucan synthetase